MLLLNLSLAESEVSLTASTAEWLYVMLGYGLLATTARLSWLIIRGWHVLAKKEVPMADFIAVLLPWAIVVAGSQISFPVTSELHIFAGFTGLFLLIVTVFASARSAVGLRWRALGMDPSGLSRLGIDTSAVVRNLLCLNIAILVPTTLILAQTVRVDEFGHWAMAGLALVLLGGRLWPVIIVAAAAATLGRIISEQSEIGSPLGLAAVVMLLLILIARRWRELDGVLRVD